MCGLCHGYVVDAAARKAWWLTMLLLQRSLRHRWGVLGGGVWRCGGMIGRSMWKLIQGQLLLIQLQKSFSTLCLCHSWNFSWTRISQMLWDTHTPSNANLAIELSCAFVCRYFRPSEVDNLRGSAKKAKKGFGWEPKLGFKQLVAMIMSGDLERAQHEKVLVDNGYIYHQQQHQHHEFFSRSQCNVSYMFPFPHASAQQLLSLLPRCTQGCWFKACFSMCRHWLWCQCLLDKSSNTTRGQLQAKTLIPIHRNAIQC